MEMTLASGSAIIAPNSGSRVPNRSKKVVSV